MKKLIASLVLAASALTSHAATGNTVMGMAQDHATAFLTGNIEGIVAALPKGVLCVPDGVTYTQVIAMVNKFMRDNPEITNAPISVITVAVMSAAFPCEKKTPQTEKPQAGKKVQL